MKRKEEELDGDRVQRALLREVGGGGGGAGR